VPESDVFIYSDKVFARLALEWEATGKVGTESWNELEVFSMKEAAN
jgi:hypothetical protein